MLIAGIFSIILSLPTPCPGYLKAKLQQSEKQRGPPGWQVDCLLFILS
ncbi:hypothetical protein EIKCOROL_01962 [Eikenella corrodens ATCC 23834]|uniref:Uncharacterized protein n=1 Tax=Eikenella corrodens ATCC 23834 TaxID=546274 RepID=C0DX58_EIKCO|nr:hypothetical protein EIKCOROL_01962 [Eikenella corrodens ATCC 23834]